MNSKANKVKTITESIEEDNVYQNQEIDVCSFEEYLMFYGEKNYSAKKLNDNYYLISRRPHKRVRNENDSNSEKEKKLVENQNSKGNESLDEEYLNRNVIGIYTNEIKKKKKSNIETLNTDHTVNSQGDQNNPNNLNASDPISPINQSLMSEIVNFWGGFILYNPLKKLGNKTKREKVFLTNNKKKIK